MATPTRARLKRQKKSALLKTVYGLKTLELEWHKPSRSLSEVQVMPSGQETLAQAEARLMSFLGIRVGETWAYTHSVQLETCNSQHVLIKNQQRTRLDTTSIEQIA